MSRFFKSTLATCLLLFVSCIAVQAQASATLSGTVEDQAGNVVPGVKVTITNPATGLRRTVVADNEGNYIVPLLPPASYTVLAEAANFKRVQFEDVILNVNDSRSLRIQLEVGDFKEVVEVPASGFTTVRADSAVATDIPGDIVRNMPLNGRSFSSLVLLTPGVTVTGADFTGQFSVNGNRPNTNYFTVDGVGANIGAISNGSSPLATVGGQLSGGLPGTTANGSTASLVSLDAVEEFKVQTSTYSAEAGRQPGAQVQLITRSGTNEFHGAVFEYFRNEALDARNYFNRKPAKQDALRQNIFGGTFGGPVMFPNFGDGGRGWYDGKNRTFFFFSYEGQRVKVPVGTAALVPSIRFRQRAAAANSPVVPLLNAYAIPTEPELLTGTPCPAPPNPPNPACDPISGRLFSGRAMFRSGVSNPQSVDSTSVRIDHRVGDKLSLFGRVNYAPSSSERYGLRALQTQFADTTTVTLGATWVARSFTNEFRFNKSQQTSEEVFRQSTIGGAVPFDLRLVTNGLGPAGRVGFLNNMSLWGGGTGNSAQNQINIVDNLTYVAGAHQLRFGMDFRRLSPKFAPNDVNRGIDFRTEAAAVAGVATGYSIVKVLAAYPQFDNISLYVQDTWKASRRLTLDLGLRWEFNPPPSERDGNMPTVITGIIGSDVSDAAEAPAGTPFYKTVYTAFAPRFGAAYLLRGRQGRETVIRGGIGIYYDLGSNEIGRGWPFVAFNDFANVPFPIPDAIASAVPSISDINTIALNENLSLPYTVQWSLAAEQSLGRSQTLSVSYVASAGRRLLTNYEVNRERTDPLTGALLPRPNPSFGDIVVTNSNASSDYHSMQVQYKARLKDKLQAIVNYTWSHGIEDFGDPVSGSLERGDFSYDIRHNLSAALHYALPRAKIVGPIGYLLRDWSVDLLIHAQSGMPFDVSGAGTLVQDGVAISVRPDLVSGVPVWIDDPAQPGGRRLNGAAFRSPATCLVSPGDETCTDVVVRQGNFGRNVLRQLPIYQADLALARTFRLRENLNLQLKGEVFNVLNTPMFFTQATDYTQSDFGIPSQTLNNRLGGAGGFSSLYQIGGPRSIQLSARITF